MTEGKFAGILDYIGNVYLFEFSPDQADAWYQTLGHLDPAILLRSARELALEMPRMPSAADLALRTRVIEAADLALRETEALCSGEPPEQPFGLRTDVDGRVVAFRTRTPGGSPPPGSDRET